MISLIYSVFPSVALKVLPSNSLEVFASCTLEVFLLAHDLVDILGIRCVVRENRAHRILPLAAIHQARLAAQQPRVLLQQPSEVACLKEKRFRGTCHLVSRAHALRICPREATCTVRITSRRGDRYITTHVFSYLISRADATRIGHARAQQLLLLLQSAAALSLLLLLLLSGVW